jgi:hypothetical protein
MLCSFFVCLFSEKKIHVDDDGRALNMEYVNRLVSCSCEVSSGTTRVSERESLCKKKKQAMKWICCCYCWVFGLAEGQFEILS